MSITLIPKYLLSGPINRLSKAPEKDTRIIDGIRRLRKWIASKSRDISDHEIDLIKILGPIVTPEIPYEAYSNPVGQQIDRAMGLRPTVGLAAAGLSAVGNFIPHPVFRGLAQAPDALLDAAQFIEEPDALNAAHVILDYPKSVSKFTKTSIDDHLHKLGVIDDAYQSVSGK